MGGDLRSFLSFLSFLLSLNGVRELVSEMGWTRRDRAGKRNKVKKQATGQAEDDAGPRWFCGKHARQTERLGGDGDGSTDVLEPWGIFRRVLIGDGSVMILWTCGTPAIESGHVEPNRMNWQMGWASASGSNRGPCWRMGVVMMPKHGTAKD